MRTEAPPRMLALAEDASVIEAKKRDVWRNMDQAPR